MHQDTTLSAVKVILELFNTDPVNVTSEKEVVTLFTGLIKITSLPPIK